MFSGNADRANALMREGLERFRMAGDRDGEGRALWSLGHLALQCGNFAAAHALFADSLSIDADLNYKHGIAISLEGMADLAAAQRQYERALRLAAAASVLREAAEMKAPVEFRRRHEGSIVSARSALGREAADAAWEAGKSLELADVISDALNSGD